MKEGSHSQATGQKVDSAMQSSTASKERDPERLTEQPFVP